MQFTVFSRKTNSPQVKQDLTSAIRKFVSTSYQMNWDLGRILRNYEMKWKSQNSMKTQASVQSPLQKWIFMIAVKTYAIAYIKVLFSCPILIDFLIFRHVFCRWLSVKPNFVRNLPHPPSSLYSLTYSTISKTLPSF